MGWDGMSITISGAWAYIAIVIMIVIVAIGIGGLIIAAVRVWVYAVEYLLVLFRINDTFRAFMREHLRKKYMKPSD